ncbi:pyridoxine/pyridoxamine 5'-phosphate oxidase [Marisediminicola senii]|uniref:pyridoxine/pyridoxamine 5'-phosphate oxidase n=1 Tax=Marisediminicola senii TaxID=2711233 RepID=UPI0013EA0159|nr:pyridoxal 5'-phosphate synthase [Marisediminicola senii]
MTNPSMRDRLRAIRPPVNELAPFDTEAAASDPRELFEQWLETAITNDVSQPTAMTLSTATADGAPSARTLLLKDLTAEGFWFASLTTAQKGADLTANPRAALTFYWPEHGRQVRVVGTVREGPRAVSERDFLARHPTARARAMAGDQSEPLPDAGTVQSRMDAARHLLALTPDFVPESWAAFVVEPETVEFWQAADGHEESRLRYRRAGGAAGTEAGTEADTAAGTDWVRERLWP